MPDKIKNNARSAPGFQARVRAVSARAEALAAQIDALHRDMKAAGNDSIPPAAFRCATAAGSARQAARELRDTATALDRIAAASAPGTCSVPWGVCHEHGNTLVSSGGKTWCRDMGCRRSWDHDRVGLPCAEPARWTLRDRQGGTVLVCDGHAVAARTELEGARIVPLEASGEGLA